MKKAFDFDKIYVIESLRKKDLKTGQSLFNDIIRVRLCQKGLNDNCKLFLPKSKDEFLKNFNDIKEEIRTNNQYPLIHLEIHGNKNGIEINNGEVLMWNELQKELIALNILCKCNLFLTVASCYGGYIFKTISPRLRTPFWGFIGPFEEVFPDDVLCDFQAFYDEFIQSLNIIKSVELLNNSNPNSKSKFRFHNTEFAFEVSYESYEKNYLTEDTIKKRLEDGLLEARKHPEMDYLSDEEIKRNQRFLMVDNKDFMKEQLMEKFFMWDLFPEKRAEYMKNKSPNQ